MLKKLLLTVIMTAFEVVSFCQTLNSDSLVIKEIIITGNYVTNKKVIFRELDFRINDRVRREDIEYKRVTSVNNLIKTSLFNFVDISISELTGNNLSVIVGLTERWYWWPNFYLNQNDRNFSEWWRTMDLNKLEYGIGIKADNFRGQGEKLMLNYHIGNFTRYEVDYGGIYLDRAKKHSLSFQGFYLAQNILPWNVEMNREKVLKLDNKLMTSINLLLKYSFRKGFFTSHTIELGYSSTRIADTIYLLNPDYEGLNNHRLNFLSVKYEFSHDTRDSKIYPKTGSLVVAGIIRKGLGILPHEYSSTGFYGQLYLYRKLYNRVYAASGLWFYSIMADRYVFSSGTGLGYIQFVRGYEYYAVNGNNAFLFKSLVKYEVLPMKVINLNFWPLKKVHQFNRVPFEIYANVFFDSGYVTDEFNVYRLNNNTLVNKLMYSTGVGVDFVTYYDKVLGLDYSFNGLGESGLFVHWKAAIR